MITPVICIRETVTHGLICKATFTFFPIPFWIDTIKHSIGYVWLEGTYSTKTKYTCKEERK